MITINGKKYAKNDKELIETLFEGRSTAVGYYKRNKKSLAIYDHQHQHIATINREGVLCCASKLDGKTWYSFCDIPIIGRMKDYHKNIQLVAGTISEV